MASGRQIYYNRVRADPRKLLSFGDICSPAMLVLDRVKLIVIYLLCDDYKID